MKQYSLIKKEMQQNGITLFLLESEQTYIIGSDAEGVEAKIKQYYAATYEPFNELHIFSTNQVILGEKIEFHKELIEINVIENVFDYLLKRDCINLYQSLNELTKLLAAADLSHETVQGDFAELVFAKEMYDENGKNIFTFSDIETEIDFDSNSINFEVKSFSGNDRNFKTSYGQYKRRPRYVVYELQNGRGISTNELIENHPLKEFAKLSKKYAKYANNPSSDQYKFEVVKRYIIDENDLDIFNISDVKGVAEIILSLDPKVFKLRDKIDD